MSEKQTKRIRRQIAAWAASQGAAYPPRGLEKMMIRAALRKIRGK